jgi:hypothetical protein
MENGGLLENAQRMASHESPRTTKLYDRTGGAVRIEEVEKDRHLTGGRDDFMASRRQWPPLAAH